MEVGKRKGLGMTDRKWEGIEGKKEEGRAEAPG